MSKLRHEVYHRHTGYSNVKLADSVVTDYDYVARYKELGQTILSSCNHEGAYNWLETQMIAEDAGLRFRYVVEAYFVKDRTDKTDRTNAHLILAAKTKKGLHDLNEVISEANLTGFYYRARIDLDLLSRLSPQDVFVTTACVGGIWRYGNEEAEQLVVWLNNHFKDSFMLEVQYHNTEKQKELNQFILQLYRKYNIPIIMGTDSHVIYPWQEDLRDLRLEANNIVYEGEDGWNLDAPDTETCIARFKTQGVLSPSQITEAINNTLIFETFDDIPLDKSRKLPNIFPEMSQEERNNLYRQWVMDGYNNLYPDVTPEQREADMVELEYEMSAITETNTSDYFLSLCKIVERAKELGGVLTPSGRGSAVSYATNHMLGLTSINRLRIPVTLYPDRFISKERLASGSLPDLDLNISGLEAFQTASKEILGEWGCVPMVAYGKLGFLSAWKMYARAENISFDESNAVSAMIKEYELAVKYADDDTKDDIQLSAYVSADYLPHVEASMVYQGIVNSVSPHPCAHLLFDGDIRREIGVMRLKGKDPDKPIFAAMVDGATADKCGYVKADYLSVDVIKLNDVAYKAAGIPLPSAGEIVEMTKDDATTWSMYAKGYTVGLNQTERAKTTERVMRFKPRNIVELSAFVAAIRPSFQSMLEIFLTRQRFSFGIPALDKLLQTPEMASSFLIYQEQIFTILKKANISPADAYIVIKAISKKNHDIIHSYMERFLREFVEYMVGDGTKEGEAQEAAKRVWQIVEDAASYSFNASHAYSVALDSLYSAYIKAHHPYEFYVSALRVYGENQDKDRLARIKNEMRQAFNIHVSPPRFGEDNRDFFIDKDAGTISDRLSSAKDISRTAAETLYELKSGQYDHFVDLLKDIVDAGGVDKRQQEILIKMGYFRDFGNEGKLLAVFNEFHDGDAKYKKSYVDATKEKRIATLREIEALTDGEPMGFAEKLRVETDYLGAPISVFENEKGAFTVLDVDTKYSPKVDMYNVATGTTGRMKVKKDIYQDAPLNPGDTFILKQWYRKPAYAYVDGKPQKKKDEYDLWIEEYKIVS